MRGRVSDTRFTLIRGGTEAKTDRQTDRQIDRQTDLVMVDFRALTDMDWTALMAGTVHRASRAMRAAQSRAPVGAGARGRENEENLCIHSRYYYNVIIVDVLSIGGGGSTRARIVSTSSNACSRTCNGS